MGGTCTQVQVQVRTGTPHGAKCILLVQHEGGEWASRHFRSRKSLAGAGMMAGRKGCSTKKGLLSNPGGKRTWIPEHLNIPCMDDDMHRHSCMHVHTQT